jgi:hypothetical protein
LVDSYHRLEPKEYLLRIVSVMGKELWVRKEHLLRIVSVMGKELWVRKELHIATEIYIQSVDVYDYVMENLFLITFFRFFVGIQKHSILFYLLVFISQEMVLFTHLCFIVFIMPG